MRESKRRVEPFVCTSKIERSAVEKLQAARRVQRADRRARDAHI